MGTQRTRHSLSSDLSNDSPPPTRNRFAMSRPPQKRSLSDGRIVFSSIALPIYHHLP